jgi:putative ABC transport system ATP-binding protein
MPTQSSLLNPNAIPSAGASAHMTMRGICKRYAAPSGAFTALDDVSLDIRRGEFVAIVGQSGSGKSTLLNLLSGIDRPTAGEIVVDGTSLHGMAERDLARWRGRAVGIVFQFFQLLPTLTAIENVMLPMDLCACWLPGERRARAEALLEQLGVPAQADKLPLTLSGGQQQRVAIARALANAPSVLLADEPTGNLDSHNAGLIMELFGSLAAQGQTVVCATHDAGVRRVCSRVVAIADGRVTEPLAG